METLFSTVSSATAGATEAGVAPNGASDSNNMFVTLLVAQIRNQNPLEPKDPSEFVTQLTQLTQTEALQKLVGQTSANAAMLEGLQVLAMGAQVGSQVTVLANRIELGEQPVQGSFTLDSGSAQTALVLTGADGAKHRVELGTRSAGVVPFTIDPAALGLPPGGYTLSVDAGDQPSPAIEIVTELTSVRFSAAGGVLLNVAHLGEVPPSAVTGFHGRQTTTSSL
jgi:flagellar basal-body rod modification protein FlgD